MIRRKWRGILWIRRSLSLNEAVPSIWSVREGILLHRSDGTLLLYPSNDFTEEPKPTQHAVQGPAAKDVILFAAAFFRHGRCVVRAVEASCCFERSREERAQECAEAYCRCPFLTRRAVERLLDERAEASASGYVEVLLIGMHYDKCFVPLSSCGSSLSEVPLLSKGGGFYDAVGSCV